MYPLMQVHIMSEDDVLERNDEILRSILQPPLSPPDAPYAWLPLQSRDHHEGTRAAADNGVPRPADEPRTHNLDARQRNRARANDDSGRHSEQHDDLRKRIDTTKASGNLVRPRRQQQPADYSWT